MYYCSRRELNACRVTFPRDAALAMYCKQESDATALLLLEDPASIGAVCSRLCNYEQLNKVSLPPSDPAFLIYNSFGDEDGISDGISDGTEDGISD